MRRQTNMIQMKEQNKTPENELNETEIANLPDVEFKTLVIRMLRDFTEYGKSVREEMKATLSEIKNNPKETNREVKVTLSEIKKNVQGTNKEGKEAGIQINNLEHNEETRILKK